MSLRRTAKGKCATGAYTKLNILIVTGFFNKLGSVGVNSVRNKGVLNLRNQLIEGFFVCNRNNLVKRIFMVSFLHNFDLAFHIRITHAGANKASAGRG